MLLLYKFLKIIFRYAVPAPVRYVLARWIAWWVCLLNARRRRVIIANLTPLVGSEQAKKKAPELLGNFLMTAVDFFCARSPSSRSVVFEGWSNIEKAYQDSRRVMIVTAHIGNWEVGISELVDKGYPVAGLYAVHTDDAIVQWIMSHRNSQVHWIPATPGAADLSVAAIEQGRVLCLAADIPFGEQGRRVSIAGHIARLPIGPWAIALRANATIVPAFIIRQAPGKYRAYIREGIKPTTEPLKHQIIKIQEAYRKHLEHYLEAYPEQWGNLQPFWDRS